MFDKVGIIFCFLLFILSCKDEINTPVDHCPSCSSTIEINDVEWTSKPDFAWYQITETHDTFFEFSLRETNPIHDQLADYISAWKIPFREGEVKLDSFHHVNESTDIEFTVYEVDYTPAQIYLPLYSEGSSSVTIQHLDKSTGDFIVSIDLHLYPFGIVNGLITNSSYPDFVRIVGDVRGKITYQ
jgi:hypothetical protein